jgi:hypothetical protein
VPISEEQGPTVPEPNKPERTIPTQQRPTAAMPSPAPTAAEVIEEREPLRGLTTDDIDSFKALNIEVCLKSETFGEMWLVPSYTGKNRQELTPEHAATICRVLQAFPGSKITAFEKTSTQNKENIQ